MEHIKEVIEKTYKIVDVTCDICQCSCRTGVEDSSNLSYGVLSFSGCYGSKHDLQEVTMHLCDNCTFEIVGKSTTRDLVKKGSPWKGMF